MLARLSRFHITALCAVLLGVLMSFSFVQIAHAEDAFNSGQVISFRGVNYTAAGTDTRANSTIKDWLIYLPPSFSCGMDIIVDNPATSGRVALRGTFADPGQGNPVIGDCKTNPDTEVLADIVTISNQADCQAQSGNWVNSVCQFASTATTGTSTLGGPGATNGVDGQEGCESKGGAFSFILCPMLGIADSAFSWLDDRIIAALNVNASYYNTPGVKAAWANFRNIAYILLVPILLVMVIGTALGFSFVDAYTVKRALPRLIIAIIFIALSFEITKLLVETSNIVGKGTAGLIAAPFGGIDNLEIDDLFVANPGNDIAFAGGAIVGGVIAFLSGVTIWGMAITLGIAVLTMLVVFILLTVREMLIIFLMILAPLAILAWIFPGNDKPWKLWWGSFSKMLIFFPLIMALIVSGRAFASVVQQTGSDEAMVISTFVKLIAFVSPYFFIPMAFKFAGSALGNLAGMVNNKEKGIVDRAKNLRGSLSKKKRHDIAAGNAFKGADEHSFRGSMNRFGKNAYLLPKANGIPTKGRMLAADLERKREEEKHLREDVGLQASVANDDWANAAQIDESKRMDFIRSIKKTNEAGEFLDDSGNVVNEAQAAQKYGEEQSQKIFDQVKFYERKHGSEGVRAQAFLAAAGSKTSFRGGPAEMLEAAIRAADGDMDMAATLYNGARGRAEQAGRLDLASYSFGTGLGEMNGINNFEGTEAERVEHFKQVNDRLIMEGLKSKSSGQIWSSHGTSVKNFAQAMANKVETADKLLSKEQEKGDKADPGMLKELHAKKMYALAELANANDQIAYFSPENADTLNTVVFAKYQKEVDAARDGADQDFRLRSRALSEQEKLDRDRMRQNPGGAAGGFAGMPPGGASGGGSYT